MEYLQLSPLSDAAIPYFFKIKIRVQARPHEWLCTNDPNSEENHNIITINVKLVGKNTVLPYS